MKSSELLRKAVKVLEAGDENCVCWALHVASGGTGHLMKAKPEVKKIFDRIRKSIVPAFFVDGWLHQNCQEFRVFEDGYQKREEYDIAMLDYRIRWCEWMAQGYERIGD